MTDARVSKVAVEVLSLPVAPSARVSKAAAEVLALPVTPSARISKVYAEVLIKPWPTGTAGIAKTALEVLVRTPRIRTINSTNPPFIKNADGTWSRIRPMER